MVGEPAWTCTECEQAHRLDADRRHNVLILLASTVENVVKVRRRFTRIASLFKRRELIAITNSRFISINRSLFGGFTMRDYQWKDLNDVKLAENILPGIFGFSLRFVTTPEAAGLPRA